MLNPNSHTPLYVQLADHLLGQIRTGVWAPGSKVPSEPEMARTFGIGRPTVRQATDVLVRRRLLERRRGAGTFVRPPDDSVDILSLGGTLASFRASGICPNVSWDGPVQDKAVPTTPGNPFSGARAFQASRLTHVDLAPVVLERFFFSRTTFPNLDKVPLGTASISDAIAARFRLRAVDARQTFRAIAANAELAERLSIAEGHPVLHVQRRLNFPSAPDAIYTDIYLQTDTLNFTQILPGTET